MKVTGGLAAIMAKITRPPLRLLNVGSKDFMNLRWITASFPCSALGLVLWNAAWDEEDYAYWEIVWNYRPGFWYNAEQKRLG